MASKMAASERADFRICANSTSFIVCKQSREKPSQRVIGYLNVSCVKHSAEHTPRA